MYVFLSFLPSFLLSFLSFLSFFSFFSLFLFLISFPSSFFFDLKGGERELDRHIDRLQRGEGREKVCDHFIEPVWKSEDNLQKSGLPCGFCGLDSRQS